MKKPLKESPHVRVFMQGDTGCWKIQAAQLQKLKDCINGKWGLTEFIGYDAEQPDMYYPIYLIPSKITGFCILPQEFYDKEYEKDLEEWKKSGNAWEE